MTRGGGLPCQLGVAFGTVRRWFNSLAGQIVVANGSPLLQRFFKAVLARR